MRSRSNTVCHFQPTYHKMAADGEEARPHRWYFTKEELTNSPSRTDGVDPDKELRYRQDAASLIQEMGPRLGLNPLCVSTAIVYMHRFYMINSFKAFDRGIIATAALFLAAKVEELPKKLEFVAKCSYSLLHKDAPPLEVPSDAYNKIVEDITFHELTILQTLGFDVQVKHPHPHVVECMNLVGVSKDLSQAAFFLAHNSQLLTTFCLQYSPTVVACMCIHLTCAWKGLEIPRSNDNKNWWEYVDSRVTQSKLEELAKEFLTIVGKSPTRLKKRIQENFKMATEGSKPGSSSGLSSGIHGNRVPSSVPPPSGSSSSSSGTIPSSSSARSKDHHHRPHPPVSNKHHGSSKALLTANAGHNAPTKVHRTSSPPPPPPPPIPHSSHNSNPSHKHKRHKEYHMPPPATTAAGLPQQHRPEKHPLTTDPHQTHKNKKIKMDESHQQKHSTMTLNDYRRKHQQTHPPLPGKGAPPTKRKPPSTESLPPLPPLTNSAHYPSSGQLKSSHRVMAGTHNHTSVPPPLPPPLPSTQMPNQSPPPPPPPPLN